MVFDVIIIGAGAAGLMCAIEAGKRGRNVLILEQAHRPGKKILMSGGGRCNFTNLNIHSDCYLSHNPHFCKSALSRYTQHDFIALVKKHKIPFHEKTLGQLFCDQKSQAILNMLLSECASVNADIQLNTVIDNVEHVSQDFFQVKTNHGIFEAQSLVVASGGLSIPTLGSSPIGYHIATQFNHTVWPTRAGLVPLTLHPEDKERFGTLSGVSTDCIVSSLTNSFREEILFTHRGLSGPVILQISSYWQPGETLFLNFLPDVNLIAMIKSVKANIGQKQVKTFLSEYLPKRLIEVLLPTELAEEQLANLSNHALETMTHHLQNRHVKPNGTEGYRTAEVTLGGVDCDELSSKTMMSCKVANLFFIGEVVDVTGWLGGYNFQWAWSSGWAAGQVA